MVDASSMVSRLYHFGLIPVYSLGVATVSTRPVYLTSGLLHRWQVNLPASKPIRTSIKYICRSIYALGYYNPISERYHLGR